MKEQTLQEIEEVEYYPEMYLSNLDEDKAEELYNAKEFLVTGCGVSKTVRKDGKSCVTIKIESIQSADQVGKQGKKKNNAIAKLMAEFIAMSKGE